MKYLKSKQKMTTINYDSGGPTKSSFKYFVMYNNMFWTIGKFADKALGILFVS